MAGAAQIAETILWRVLGRSHLILLATALVILVNAVLNVPSVRTGGNSVTTPSGVMITLQWTIHSEIISLVGIIVLYAGCCYVLREILRNLAIARHYDGIMPLFDGLRESEIEVIINRWIEKTLLALALIFVVLAVLDFVTGFLRIHEAVNYSWATKLVNPLRTAAPKLFYATVLFFLQILLAMLRAERDHS